MYKRHTILSFSRLFTKSIPTKKTVGREYFADLAGSEYISGDNLFFEIWYDRNTASSRDKEEVKISKKSKKYIEESGTSAQKSQNWFV